MVSFLWVKVIDTTFSRSVVGKKISNSCLWHRIHVSGEQRTEIFLPRLVDFLLKVKKSMQKIWGSEIYSACFVDE